MMAEDRAAYVSKASYDIDYTRWEAGLLDKGGNLCGLELSLAWGKLNLSHVTHSQGCLLAAFQDDCVPNNERRS